MVAYALFVWVLIFSGAFGIGGPILALAAYACGFWIGRRRRR